MLCNSETWERLKAIGIEDWVARKRDEGKIKNFGFSFHGGKNDFLGLLDAYNWDFCMVQYNYFDENNQAGITGVRAAYEKGIPVIAMEPLLGGTLVNGMPEEAKRAFESLKKERSLADWALRWVLNHKEVPIALSGMSNEAQLNENVAVAEDAAVDSLSESELAVYKSAVAALMKTIKVKCTGCGYCMPCPQGVDIPSCFTCYNVSYSFGLVDGIGQYVQNTGQMSSSRSDASLCNSCGKCEKHCPQSIQIRKELVNVKRRMWSFAVLPLFKLLRKIWRIG